MSRNRRVFGFGGAEAVTLLPWRLLNGVTQRGLMREVRWRHQGWRGEKGGGGGCYLRSDWLWLIMSCH